MHRDTNLLVTKTKNNLHMIEQTQIFKEHLEVIQSIDKELNAILIKVYTTYILFRK